MVETIFQIQKLLQSEEIVEVEYKKIVELKDSPHITISTLKTQKSRLTRKTRITCISKLRKAHLSVIEPCAIDNTRPTRSQNSKGQLIFEISAGR